MGLQDYFQQNHDNPLKMLADGALVGGATYAAPRLLYDLISAINKKVQTADHSAPTDKMEVEIPASRLAPFLGKTAQQKTAGDSIIDPVLAAISGAFGGQLEGGTKLLMPGATTALGAAGGFMGLSKLYEYHKKKELADKIENAKKEYLKELSKTASATPCVDYLCKLAFLDFSENRTDNALSGISALIKSMAKHTVGDGGEPSSMTLPGAVLMASLATGAAAPIFLGNRMHAKRMEEEDKQRANVRTPDSIPVNLKVV